MGNFTHVEFPPNILLLVKDALGPLMSTIERFTVYDIKCHDLSG